MKTRKMLIFSATYLGAFFIRLNMLGRVSNEPKIFEKLMKSDTKKNKEIKVSPLMPIRVKDRFRG